MIGIGSSKIAIATSGLLVIIVIATAYSITYTFQLDVYYFDKGTTYHTNEIYPNMVDLRFTTSLLGTCLALWFLISLVHRLASIILFAIVAITVVHYVLFDSLYYNFIISIITLPTIGSLFITQVFARNKVLRFDTNRLFIAYLSIGVLLLSILSLFFSINFIGGDFGGNFQDFSYLLITILAWFSPIIVFLIAFTLPLRLVWSEIQNRFSFRLSKYTIHLSQARLDTRSRCISLGLITSVAIIIVLIPQFSHDNNASLGVDTPQYTQAIQNFTELQDTNGKIQFLFKEYSNGDRPIAIFIIALLVSWNQIPENTGSIIEVILLPILSVALCLVIYFLTTEITNNERTAILASFLTAFSPQVLIGLYAGFYANWMALVFCFIAILFMARYLRRNNRIWIILFALSLVTAILTHVHTYTVFLYGLLIFLVASLFGRYFNKHLIILIISVLLLTFVVDLIRGVIFETSAGTALSLSVAENFQAGLDQFDSRWSNLIRTVQVHVGGFFGSSVIILSLALIGAVLIERKQRSPLVILIICFHSIAIVPLFLGDRVIMARVLYDIPFQIPAALALTGLTNVKNIGLIAVLSILMYSAAAAIHSVTNL